MKLTMKLSQVYFLSMTLCKISQGEQDNDGEAAPIPTLFHDHDHNEVSLEDASATKKRLVVGSSSEKRKCFNVSLQMSAMVL